MNHSITDLGAEQVEVMALSVMHQSSEQNLPAMQ